MIYISSLLLYHKTDSCICREERRGLAAAKYLSELSIYILILLIIYPHLDNSFFLCCFIVGFGFFIMGYTNISWSELFAKLFLVSVINNQQLPKVDSLLQMMLPWFFYRMLLIMLPSCYESIFQKLVLGHDA